MTRWPDPEELARFFHNAYEELAPQFGYATRQASAKPWEHVPKQNRDLMIAVCERVLAYLGEGNPYAGVAPQTEHHDPDCPRRNPGYAPAIGSACCRARVEQLNALPPHS